MSAALIRQFGATPVDQREDVTRVLGFDVVSDGVGKDASGARKGGGSRR